MHPDKKISGKTFKHTIDERRIEAGKIPLTRKKGQHVSINGNDVRLADLQWGFAWKLQDLGEDKWIFFDEYPIKEGGSMRGKLGLALCGKILPEPAFYGNKGAFWTATNAVCLDGPLGHPDTKGVLLKLWITKGGAKGSDSFDFFAKTQIPPLFAPHLGGPPIHEILAAKGITNVKFVMSDST